MIVVSKRVVTIESTLRILSEDWVQSIKEYRECKTRGLSCVSL